MRAPGLALAGSLSSVASLVVACSVAEIPGAGTGVRPTGAAPASADVPCAQASFLKEDVTKLTACACKAGGKAHCVATKMPPALSKELESCDGAAGACVPDTIIAGAVPATCRSQGGEGRCLSLCVPKVAELASALTRGDGDACPTDERCVPCVNPATGEQTGACDIGKTDRCDGTDAPPGTTGDGGPIRCPFTGTPMDVSGYGVCAPGGRCVKESLIERMIVDPKTRQQLKERLSPCEGAGLCVPEDYLKEYGQHKPTECSSFAGIEGRCFSTVFKDINAQKDVLARDACSALERCVPCFNPATGQPTGACASVSCDQAKTTPPRLKDCCRLDGQTRGKCVPTKDVPSQFQSRLDAHECDGDIELCVPSDNLDPNAKPVACTVGVTKGVCVSDCMEFGVIVGAVLIQGTCKPNQTCIPCVNPVTREPTGAPGC